MWQTEFLELYIASSNSYYYELYESYLVSSQGRWNKGYIIGRAIRRHDWLMYKRLGRLMHADEARARQEGRMQACTIESSINEN